MTDLTTNLSILLVETHKSSPITSLPDHQHTLNKFLIDAREIHASISKLLNYVRAIRTPYLSTAPPPRRNQKHDPAHTGSQTVPRAIPTYVTDAQREEIDTFTASSLREINANISNLRQATSVAHETTQQRLIKKYGKSTNFLLRWAAGGEDANVGDAGKTQARIEEEGQERTTHMFREGVLWFLNWGLEKAVRAEQDMVEIRLEREREKKASILYDERNRNVKLDRATDTQDAEARYGNIDLRGHDSYNPVLHVPSDTEQLALSPEQMQLFEEENNSLMNHYNETLTQVTHVEKNLMEISSLQQTLVGHLNVQGEMIGSLVADAERTDENVQRGNKELKRATERTRTAKIMYHSTLWLCAGLVVWDLIF